MSLKSKLNRAIDNFIKTFYEEMIKESLKLIIESMIAIDIKIAELKERKRIEEQRYRCKCCRCKKW